MRIPHLPRYSRIAYASLASLVICQWTAYAFVGPKPRDVGLHRPPPTTCFVSRLRSSLQESPISQTDRTQHEDTLFQELYQAIDVDATSDLVRLQSTQTPDGTSVRGVYLNRPVKANDAILSIPLSQCLRDDEPPAWLDCDLLNPDEGDPDEPCLIAGYYNPSDWATRLAASLLDTQLQREHSIDETTDLWLSLLPNPDFLRASLPIHWPSEIVQSASNTALELAVDSAFFAFAQAVQVLLQGLQRNAPPSVKQLGEEELHRLCENALDIVQTRSCRVTLSRNDDAEIDSNMPSAWSPPLRLLAPVFDFINHPSSGKANAEFVLTYNEDDDDEEELLVVKALRDLDADEEVLIDYGDSARPAWKCLSSYGFVPSFNPSNDEAGDDQLAEVYMDGVRYEVGAETVPEDIVAAMSGDPSGEVTLTPDIAIRLACRLSDVAYQLLLDPLDRYREDDKGVSAESAEDVLSAQLAASLRWNQHRILLACSLGLRDWAVDANGHHAEAKEEENA